MRSITQFFILCFLGALTLVHAEKMDPSIIIKKCIARHGGFEKFSNVKDIYAKMRVYTYPEGGRTESTFKEYYRKPDKIRIEIEPGGQPPAKMGWDGENVRHLVKGKLQITDSPKRVNQIQESLRFIKLMILTNLLEKGSVLKYEKYWKSKKIHIISQRDKKAEKIWLFISAKSYVLLGAQFYFRNNKAPFKVIFSTHRWYGKMYLPRRTKLYKRNKLIMQAMLSKVMTNKIKNGNSFFRNLKEKVKFKKKSRWRRK